MKVNQVANNESGLSARTKWNEAMKTVEHTIRMTGTGEVGNELDVVLLDEDDMASNSDQLPVTQQSLVAYIDNLQLVLQDFFSWNSFSFQSRSGTVGTSYVGGYYLSEQNAFNADEGNFVGTYGESVVGYAAYFFLVSSGNAVTDGGPMVLTLTGTSIDNLGNRVPADSEILVTDALLLGINDYVQSTKKWLGEVTFTLTSLAATVFSWDFNYGYAAYEETDGASIQLNKIELLGSASGNDNIFNVEVLHHDQVGWIYNDGAFEPGGTSIIMNLQTDYVNEFKLRTGEYFSYKKYNLAYTINPNDGLLVRITTDSTNSVGNMDIHLKGNTL